MHKYLDTQGHNDTPDRQTHISARNTCTPTPTATLTCIPTRPSIAPALLQLSLTPFYPHPPGGGDVPEGTEDFGPFLSSAGSRVTSTAPSLRPGVPSWVPGPGRRQAQTLRPLLGEQRGLLVHCPPSSSHRGFSQRPLCRLCRYVGPGRQGSGRGAARARPGGIWAAGVWALGTG